MKNETSRRYFSLVILLALLALSARARAADYQLKWDNAGQGVASAVDLADVQWLRMITEGNLAGHWKVARRGAGIEGVLDPYVETPGGIVSVAPGQTLESFRVLLGDLESKGYQFGRVEWVSWSGILRSHPLSQLRNVQQEGDGTWLYEFADGESYSTGSPSFRLQQANRTLSGPVDLEALRAEERQVQERHARFGVKLEGRIGTLRDLTHLAYQGKLDPVVARKNEVDRMVQILNARQKNNPVLIGEAGVGKTALPRELARRIVAGEVPPSLQNRRVVVLDLALLLAGASFRGQFEDRLNEVLNQAEQERAILFIDELHTVLGAGGAEGALDASHILKPRLTDGELTTIGATTLDEYRRIEKDGALSRRFRDVLVEQPNDADALAMLQSHIPAWTEHYALPDGRTIQVPTETLRSAVLWARRYLAERRLPDSAKELVELSLSKLQIEALAGHRADVQLTDHDLAVEMHQQTRIPVAHLMSLASSDHGARALRKHMKQHIIAQPEAIDGVTKVVTVARQRLNDPRRPLGVILAAGETGVGKTETFRQLAIHQFGDEEALIKIDMSDLAEKHNVSRLGGAPPGYVGYQDRTQLMDRVRRRPYSVVLFDEIDKAHPDALDLLLQIMEDGGMHDPQGRFVDFRNTIIVMTTNAGAEEGRRAAKGPPGFHGYVDPEEAERKQSEAVKEAVLKALRQRWKLEFLNRIDKVIVFNRLGRRDLQKILKLEFGKVQARVREQHGAELLATRRALDELLERGVDPELGARPMRRAVHTNVTEGLATFLETEFERRSRSGAGAEPPAGTVLRVDFRAPKGFQFRRVKGTRTVVSRARAVP
jgi:ATP-dependent Clp protease ATP-binding subunit ClpC